MNIVIITIIIMNQVLIRLTSFLSTLTTQLIVTRTKIIILIVKKMYNSIELKEVYKTVLK